MKRNTTLLIALCLAALALPRPAAAQLENLNVDRLIKEMREKGMSELLVRLANDGVSIKDPADAKKLAVEMLIMRAQTRVESNPNDYKERVKALEDGITEFQALINQYRESPKRPLWQADLALHLIYTRMQLHMADDFYEFGMATAEQKSVFESGAALAIEQLIDADIFLADLQRRLPRQDDYNQTYVNTGRWEELMDEYLKTKVPFLLAQAAYLASLLPDSHPYYQNLGKNPRVPLQAANPAAERTRLLNMAVERLAGIPTELALKYGLASDESGSVVFIRPVPLTRGKALVRLGKFEEAGPLLDAVAAMPKDDLLAYRVGLMKAVALELKMKNPQQAIELLDGLKDHPMTQASYLYMVVVTDLQHRLLMKHAGTDKKKIEEAYHPYDVLLTDKRLVGQTLDDTRMFVYDRWTKAFAGQKQETLPPMVLSGMSEMERLIGNHHVALWKKHQDEGKEAEAEAEMKTGRERLDKSIDIADVLINRTDVPPEVKARARYNKAYASYLKDPENFQAFLRAAAIWTELADQLPKHPLAEEAIGRAVGFLHNLHVQDPRPGGVDEAYRNTTSVLYDRLPESKVAEDERTYYTFNVLQAEGKWKEAAASYDKVPPQHRDYVEARREWVFCQMQLWRAMPENAEKGARRDTLKDDINKAERDTRTEFESEGDTGRRQMFKKTLGDLVLSRVELSMHRKDWDEADRALRNFADDYPDEPDLIRLAMAKRIIVKVKQGDAKAVELAEELMKASGDNAAQQSSAAATIDAALGELGTEIEDLRAAADTEPSEVVQAELRERATRQAVASDKLSDMLLKWGTDNNVGADQMFRYNLMKARSAVLTGKRAEAAEAVSKLAAAPGGDEEPRVIFLQGEVLLMGGKRPEVIQAIGRFMKITSLVEVTRITPQMPADDRLKAEAFNGVWWQSWLRILQSYDKLKEQTEQIPRIVKQLKAQYPELGGPALKGKFDALENKYR